MKRCDCEHYEICPTCFPQGFDEDGNRKPVERPPTRAELVEKIAELEAENKELRTNLSNCDGELIHYQVDVAQQAERIKELEQDLQTTADALGHAHQDIERLERESSACDLLEEQKGTIKALNLALGGMKLYSTPQPCPRCAELTSAIDEQMVVTHLGVFNPGDDPKVAIHRLMCWSQSVGEYFAKDKLAALEAKCATLEPVIRAIGNFIGRKYLIAWNDESLSDLVIQLLTERDKQLAALETLKGHPL